MSCYPTHPAAGPQPPPYLHILVDRAIAVARTALGSAAFETAQAEGVARSEEQAIAQALEETALGSKGTGGLLRTTVSD